MHYYFLIVKTVLKTCRADRDGAAWKSLLLNYVSGLTAGRLPVTGKVTDSHKFYPDPCLSIAKVPAFSSNPGIAITYQFFIQFVKLI